MDTVHYDADAEHEIATLRADNERLRSALTEMADADVAPNTVGSCLVAKARAALASGGAA